MSLSVQNLTKTYGSQKAVDDISFHVGKGEIVGFLGPNGAGKSTTMKIATGFLPATSGCVRIQDFDVAAEPMRVKRITGYLPEHNPLYLDLFVHEYLRFVGGVYGIRGAALKSRVAEMIALCGLEREQNKKLEALSKGYRQRVGLAQALIHDPDVLILDEPTSGLDPNQILEIRRVIRHISVAKTVIFSTHILQEVEALCDRVVVINKGKIVADDRLDRLMQRRSAANAIIIETERAVDTDRLKKISGIAGVVEVAEEKGVFRYRIVPEKDVDIRTEIFRFASDNHVALLGLRQEEGSLENIFRELTAGSPDP